MKRKLLLLLVIGCVFEAGLVTAAAWDYEGHRLINQLALSCLPTNFPSFVREPATEERVAFLGGEADRWRNVQDLTLRHCNGPDHYIDLEQLSDYGLNPQQLPIFRYDFVAQLALIRHAHPDKFPPPDAARNEDHTRELVGLLPWAIVENYAKVKSGFAYLKAYGQNGGTPEEIANAEANIVYVMGVMGHYVGDASQPLHTTIHHHGWVGDNPHGYTTNSRFHSWIDGGYLAKAGVPSLDHLKTRLRPARQVTINGRNAKPEEIFQLVMNFLIEQNKQVEPLYQLEKEGKLSGKEETGLAGKSFLEEQLLRSGQLLADLWYSAWQQAPPDTFLTRQLAARKKPAARTQSSRAASAVRGPRGQNMDSQLEAFFRQYLEQHFRQRPLAATELGDHRFDHLLDDVSPAARRAWAELDRETLAVLPRQIQYDRLSRGAQIDYEIFQHELQSSIWLSENTHPFEEDPRVYNRYISDSVFLPLAQSTLPKETNIANCLARMEHIPGVIATAERTLTNPPRVFVETAIRQNQGAVGFYQKDLFDLAGPTPQLAALKGSAARVVRCLEDYQQFLEKKLLPSAHGEWRLGRDKFYRKLELVMDAGVDADQVFADAKNEFDRVQRDMYVIARQLWSRYFPNAALPPDDAAGRRATIQQVLTRIGQDHGEPAKLIDDTRQTVARLKHFIQAHDILRLPDPDTCQVIEMPEFQRGNATAYMNSPPPLDPKANGYFAVSPPPKDWDAAKVNSFLEEYNRSMLQVLTIHEAYPGHYVQFAYANRNPSLIRHVLGSGVFIEGWAVYTEQMMLDQGYGQGDLALRLSQLKFYLRAVANAILDHEMHCSRLTDEQALTFLMDDAYQSEGEARLKIIRAKQSSVQLSTYFVGRMAHYRLRQAVERELGDRFNLGRYNEAVLANGPVPVKYLPELVRERLRQPR